MRDTVLALHVMAGTAGLLLGPAWLLLRRRGMSGLAAAWSYHLAVAGVVASSAFLAVTAAGLWWLLPFGALTEALAVTGALARRRSWRGWRSWQPHLLGGSYIALVTGVLVAGTADPIFWLLPAVVGQLPIALAKRRLHAVAPAPLPA
ncbi:hypothetical protein [Blastococcus mobilis]|uniref:DUF2306 domain-containing protein n=1 Tax=Blastococcus mobilis TaxID=1938746 RepID=A0A238VVW9_9ACTN|nr:hypothetical protein [Blastococcus mobilis]SNR38274.1 hypothetical protein SAMN06272737_10570 [Blastococcus mobilis]